MAVNALVWPALLQHLWKDMSTGVWVCPLGVELGMFFSSPRKVVVKWDEERGFGKVRCTDGRELFVHRNYLQQTAMSLGSC